MGHNLKTAFKRYRASKPKISVVLVDGLAEGDFHILDCLAEQTLPRDDYEIIWVEYYDRRAVGLDEKIAAFAAAERQAPLDLWLIAGMPEDVCRHDHLMFNIGLFRSRGDIVVFCDPAAALDPAFLATALEAFARSPKIVLHFDAACICARREDLIAVGGADEHADYFGRISGSYEIGFRLVNYGLTETWAQSAFPRRAKRPAAKETPACAGPDARHGTASAASAARIAGRVTPAVENAAIREERENGRSASATALIDNARYAAAQAAPAQAPLPPPAPAAGPQRVRALGASDILLYENTYYGVPHSFGPWDPTNEAHRNHPQVVRADQVEDVERIMSANQNGQELPPPVLVENLGVYNLVFWNEAYYAAPMSLGSTDISDPVQRSHPEIIVADTLSAARALVRAKRLERLEGAKSAYEDLVGRLQEDLKAKDELIAQLKREADAQNRTVAMLQAQLQQL